MIANKIFHVTVLLLVYVCDQFVAPESTEIRHNRRHCSVCDQLQWYSATRTIFWQKHITTLSIHSYTCRGIKTGAGLPLSGVQAYYMPQIWPERPKLDGPAYEYAQNIIAGVNVGRKIIIRRRFDNHYALLVLWYVCLFGQSGLAARAVSML